ncbi:minor capsid protein [Streptomyces sp. NPDC050597]|uniref:minor capsid protein n=1 Tax=unclassified Streptomyces TaxID=2593676 RepID=UPI0033D6915A
MSFTRDLVDGLAQLLAANGVGAYRPDGVYAAGETAITDTALPPSPDRAVVLTAYMPEESPNLADCTVMVQVRTRAGPDPREVADLDDAAHTVLHASGRHTFGSVRVQFIRRISAAVLGPDGQGRHERTSNYRIGALQAHPNLEP